MLIISRERKCQARAVRCALTFVVGTLLLLPAPEVGATHMGQEWRQSVTEHLDIPREAFSTLRRDPGRLLHYIRHDIPVVIDGMCDAESLRRINASQAASRPGASGSFRNKTPPGEASAHGQRQPLVGDT